ncbi:uncharacterized protein LOC132045537 isoform X3 [Lycium ferocissimum]|uniref:uncharacterized protein LOC132045537 isoform X3 n=1 Tax=Lycium ferocissimum TaxID=112874 RepID=UPI0028163ADA|nr:uncharacterized protein LOC132045537 isoform X3 [Lycium ferocissimum]
MVMFLFSVADNGGMQMRSLIPSYPGNSQDKGKLELPQLLDNSKDDHLIVVQLFCFGTLIFMRIFWFVESDGYADDYLVDFLSTMK